jgi:hypothetical protein
MPTSPSAIPLIYSSCIPQKSAICLKVSAVFSTSQIAVALGISGNVIELVLKLNIKKPYI